MGKMTVSIYQQECCMYSCAMFLPLGPLSYLSSLLEPVVLQASACFRFDSSPNLPLAHTHFSALILYQVMPLN